MRSFLLTILLSIFIQQSAICQKVVKYYANIRDSSRIKDSFYGYNNCDIKCKKSDLHKILTRLSKDSLSEVFVLRCGIISNDITISIQNWDYKDMPPNNMDVYGIFRTSNGKDFFVCYDSRESLEVTKSIFWKTKQQKFYQIEVEFLPNNVYIIKNDMTTYYNGYYKGKSLITNKLIFNNKEIRW